MKFNYYDTLSNLVVGFMLLFVILYLCNIEYKEEFVVPYLAGGYILGYFINAISSLLEGFYCWTIKGRPSNKLLQVDPSKAYSGVKKVPFYRTVEVVALLRENLDDANAKEGKMFGEAMKATSHLTDSLIPIFNAQYVFSRVILTFVTLSAILIIVRFYNCGYSYLILILVAIAWNRFRERGYYYAREVLKEYLKLKDK